MNIKCNIGETDKTIRWILGLVILIIGFVYRSWFGLIGLVLIITDIIGFCPLYTILKISTCKEHPVKKSQ